MLGDTAYDGDGSRQELDQRGTKPVIPNHPNRKHPLSFNKRLYKLRWRIESAINRLKDFRRIATRYDRLARNYLASVLPHRRARMVDLLSPDASHEEKARAKQQRRKEVSIQEYQSFGGAGCTAKRSSACSCCRTARPSAPQV